MHVRIKIFDRTHETILSRTCPVTGSPDHMLPPCTLLMKHVPCCVSMKCMVCVRWNGREKIIMLPVHATWHVAIELNSEWSVTELTSLADLTLTTSNSTHFVLEGFQNVHLMRKLPPTPIDILCRFHSTLTHAHNAYVRVTFCIISTFVNLTRNKRLHEPHSC